MSIESAAYNMVGGNYNDLVAALMKLGDASKTASAVRNAKEAQRSL